MQIEIIFYGALTFLYDSPDKVMLNAFSKKNPVTKIATGFIKNEKNFILYLLLLSYLLLILLFFLHQVFLLLLVSFWPVLF